MTAMEGYIIVKEAGEGVFKSAESQGDDDE